MPLSHRSLPAVAPWSTHNDAGLEAMALQQWPDAIAAFERARECLTDVHADDARAVVLGNLAGALLRASRVDEAEAHAHESLALRRDQWGDETVTFARALSDHAVVLCVQQRVAEARPMFEQAIRIVDRELGDESPYLVPLLENAARAALLAGDGASAEPLVLRLHALLGALDIPTHAADRLFAMVAESRDATIRVEPVVESSDDARSSAEADREAAAREAAERSDTPVADASADIALELVGDDETEGDGLGIDGLELVEPAPPTLDHVPDHRRDVHRDDHALGFLVQHGTSVTPDAPFDLLDGPIGPLPELATAVDASLSEETPVEPAPTVAGDLPMASSLAEPMPSATTAASRGPTPHRGTPIRRASNEMPVVMPSPARGQAAVADFEIDDDAPPRNALHLPGQDERGANTSVLRDQPRLRASGGARVWLVVGGGLAAVALAVGWYFVRGAF